MRRALHLTLLVMFTVASFALFTAAGAQAKGGHGHGPHIKMSRVGSPPGWSKGRKIGWRSYGCPPGLAKQGRC